MHLNTNPRIFVYGNFTLQHQYKKNYTTLYDTTVSVGLNSYTAPQNSQLSNRLLNQDSIGCSKITRKQTYEKNLCHRYKFCNG